jgi:hypothetical protein
MDGLKTTARFAESMHPRYSARPLRSKAGRCTPPCSHLTSPSGVVLVVHKKFLTLLRSKSSRYLGQAGVFATLNKVAAVRLEHQVDNNYQSTVGRTLGKGEVTTYNRVNELELLKSQSHLHFGRNDETG